MKKVCGDKKVVIYCRESRDDGYGNYERIETQRDILIDYCEKKKLGKITGIIMDDNKSGTNFMRLEPVKEMAMRHEIDILLCKDASRLGRNILESLKFTEFLTQQSVELVFESERYDEDMFPLIAWFNERRAKDDSEKIRRVLRHKMEDGSIVIKAPYGYIKNGNSLIIEDETAQIVKEAYEMFANGISMREIASVFNNKGYPTPSQVKSRQDKINYVKIWNKQHIERILKHIAYTGDMPYGMRQKISYKSKKYVNKKQEEWIIIKNHHEAVISRDLFEIVQEKLHKNLQVKPRRSMNNIFSGVLFCGRCGTRMIRKERKNRPTAYVCGKSDKEGAVKKQKYGISMGCGSHRIWESILYGLVKDYLHRLLLDKKYEKYISAELESQPVMMCELERQIELYQLKIDDLQRKASKIYDDRLNSDLPLFLFEKKIQDIVNDINEYQAKKKAAESSIATQRDDGNRLTVDSVLEYIDNGGLNNSIVTMLFNKIIVFEPEDINELHVIDYSLADTEYNGLISEGGIVFELNY